MNNVTISREIMRARQVMSLPFSSYLSVEFDSQYGVGIRVVADLGSLLEVTDFELPGGLQADDGHQTAGEQTLHNTHILRVRCRDTQIITSYLLLSSFITCLSVTQTILME